MRIVPRSRLPVLLILFVVGAGAVGHWIYWLAQPGSGDADVAKSGVFFLVFFYFPSALAGLLAVGGAALALRWPLAGGILGTIALAVAIFYALFWLGSNIGLLAECRSLPRGCADEWQTIGLAAPGLALAAYLLVAIWKAEHPPRRT